MLFGHKDNFAIEAMTEPNLTPPSAVWGRMRIWCQGVSIGDYSESCCALYPAYTHFKNITSTLPNLWRQDFDNLDEITLWNKVDGALYGHHGDIELSDNRTLKECQDDADNFEKFNFLTNWGEQFDRSGKSFIFCPDKKTVTILHCQPPKNHVISLQAPAQSVCDAITLFITWFATETSRLGGDS